jgi:hypothetical protein
LSNKMQSTQNLKNSPFGHFGTKITCPVKNTIPVQIKNYSPFFFTKGQRVKQSKKKNHTKITPISVSEGQG